ncbi:MAG: TIGR00295 family protein [Candidatus Bathyarchaeia archaeon]
MSKRLPSEKTALKLLMQTGCSEKVIRHCKAVADFAVEIAKACKGKGLKVDVDLVRVGAILHDIGRAKTHNVDHGIIGAQIAKELNLSNAVVSIIERHVGSGITENEAEKLGWPVKSYVPRFFEERIVAYADKLIEGSRRLPVEAAVERFRRDRRIPESSVERLKQWHKELSFCLKG